MIALAIVIESLFICSFIRERESRHAITDTLRPVFGCCQQGLALIEENWFMFRVDGPQIGVGRKLVVPPLWFGKKAFKT